MFGRRLSCEKMSMFSQDDSEKLRTSFDPDPSLIPSLT